MNGENFQNFFSSWMAEGQFRESLPTENLLQQMIPVGSLTNEEVLKVYASDYRARLTEALGENYETTWLVLGDDRFFDIALKYIEANPSSNPDLSHYGKNFPYFLRHYKYFAEWKIDIPFLEELAYFEKNFWEIFHSPFFSGQPICQLSSSDSLASVEFRQPFLLLKSEFQIWELFKIRKRSNFELGLLNLHAPQFGIIFRSKSGTDFYSITDFQYGLIQDLKDGRSPLELLNQVGPDHYEEATNLVQFLFQSR